MLPPVPDVVVIVDDRSLGTATMAAAIDSKHPKVRMLVIPARGYKRLPQGYPRTMEPLPDNWKPAYLLERLQLILRAKRGPKPGFKRPTSVRSQIQTETESQSAIAR